MVIGRAPARVSLVGGGTDLPAYYERHGGAVVSFALGLYSTAFLTPRAADLELISRDSGARELVSAATFTRRMRAPILAEEFLLYQKAVALHFGIDRGTIAVASEVPPGAGLASSGALCVALVQAAAMFTGEDLDRDGVAEAAFEVETKLLRRAVGKQDQYACAFGGMNLIEFYRDGSVELSPLRSTEETTRTLQRRLLLFHNGARRSAAGPLQEQARRSATDVETIKALNRLKDLAYQVRDVLEQGDVDAVGPLMHEAWEAKQHLNSQVSTPEITRVYALARRAGAAGGKLAGAGLAGTLVLYCQEDTQDEVRRMMASQGWRERSFTIDLEGSSARVDIGASDDLIRT